jgi:hypothetical protein
MVVQFGVSGENEYVRVERNVGYANGGVGIEWLTANATTVGCNDWFGNAKGDIRGRPASAEDFSDDPLFCDAAGGDFRLRDMSPLVDRVGCGQVGALGVGCGVTATVVRRLTADRVSDGVRVAWELEEGSTASEIWVERSENGLGWSRPATERWREGRVVVELDRSVGLEQGYWYRLVAQEGRDVVILGAAVRVEASPTARFALVRVSPNPARGPVRIEFSLASAAAIDLELFDVQGRSVASLAHGQWPAGKHVAAWPGLTRGGTTAPSGLYVVRFRYPGGEESRRFVRSS